MPKSLLATLLLGALALGAIGCGASRADNTVKYAVTAQENYTKGEKKLEKKAWVGAAKYFAFVKARFAYSKFAVLAELRLADAEFGAGHHLVAIDGYKMFTKFHPTHDMVINGYCAFRIGEAYVKMLPGDWWLLPPSHEKDQSATADAHRQLTTFLKKYPKSPYQEKALARLAKINWRLAEHEMYVAKFYWERGRAMGTVIRLRKLLESHAGTKLDAPAMYLLGKAYVRVKMYARAKEVWIKLVETHPTHSKAKQAQAALAGLSG
ncbi:MAG: outer membrane protein assembly factor BamD [Myxococcales bacterium]|nr:outer membrane protein assembly factor BamD [Myxococcales bacterium]